jgi:hypothetical protein
VLDLLELTQVDPGVSGHEASAVGEWHDLVVDAVHDHQVQWSGVAEPDCGVGGVVPLRDLLGFTAEQSLDGIVTQAGARSGAQVTDRREPDDTVHRVSLAGEPQHEVPARGVPGVRRSGSRDPQASKEIRQRADRGVDVVQGGGPASGATDTAVLGDRHDVPLILEGVAERPDVPAVIGLLPETAVDEHDERMRAGTGWEVQVDDAVLVPGVAHHGVRQRGRAREQFPGIHAATVAARVASMTQTKWEYITAPVLVHATKQILDNFGQDGWELVQVVPGMNPENLVAYFKRPTA